MTTQIRIRTRDMFTDVSETRPDEDGFSMSWKVYGPFATANEQRAFMRGLWESVPLTKENEEQRALILAEIDAWVRFDEEEGYQAPTPELEAPDSSESVIAAPSADEVSRYASSDVRGGDVVIDADVKIMIDGFKRVVW